MTTVGGWIMSGRGLYDRERDLDRDRDLDGEQDPLSKGRGKGGGIIVIRAPLRSLAASCVSYDGSKGFTNVKKLS